MGLGVRRRAGPSPSWDPLDPSVGYSDLVARRWDAAPRVCLSLSLCERVCVWLEWLLS